VIFRAVLGNRDLKRVIILSLGNLNFTKKGKSSILDGTLILRIKACVTGGNMLQIINLFLLKNNALSSRIPLRQKFFKLFRGGGGTKFSGGNFPFNTLIVLLNF